MTKEEINKRFVWALEKIRFEKGLSVVKFANILGIHRGSYDNWIYYKFSPSWPTVVQIAEKLNININEFLKEV